MSRKPADIPVDVWKKRLRLQSGGFLEDMPPVDPAKRFYSFLPLECPDCGRVRYLKTNDWRKANQENMICKSCSCHYKGIEGAKVFRRRYGHDEFLAMMQKVQLNKKDVNKSECKAREILQEILPDGFHIAEQVVEYGRILDFVITYGTGDIESDGWVVILEINGYWHRRNADRALRDRALKMTSMFPIEFVDDRILFHDAGQQKFASMVHNYIVKFKESVLCM